MMTTGQSAQAMNHRCTADALVRRGYFGDSATLDVGTGSGDVAAGDHSHGAAAIGHVLISTPQNIGGANGTITYIDWDAQLRVDTGTTHSTSTNPSRVEVDAIGRHTIKVSVGWQQTGSARITERMFLRVNGSMIVDRCPTGADEGTPPPALDRARPPRRQIRRGTSKAAGPSLI